ncbi:MAG: ATP-dependent DNA helicase RecG [Micrococcaceae bacterium]
MDTVLDAINWDSVEDPVPTELLRDASDSLEPLPTLAEAFRSLHRPRQVSEALRAKTRFALHEALILQGVLSNRRQQNATQSASTPYPRREDGIAGALDQRLPFTLTDGQRDAGAAISNSLDSIHPMSRLLQGEVGSGKTLVALRAMAQVVDGGGQAALIAPTEVLAGQHHRSLLSTLDVLATAGQLTSWTGPSTEVVLLTGSQSTQAKREALLKIASGQAGIVVGTHALLSEYVSFAQLGLVVIDEQHRFGVDQREALRESNPGTHMLVMSATPIPRSVAMTVFGDLDVTVLDGMPSGRKPVATHVARMDHGPRIIGRVWEIISEQVAAGHQAFVVCPKITPSQSATETNTDHGGAELSLTAPELAAAVEDMVERLPQIPSLTGLRVAALHGQMDQTKQDEAMGRFVRGEIDILVATTVIEVGVDVPNATVMAVLDADAFGLSTLHQLRGRVGRGEAPALCFLTTRLPDGHAALDRLDILAETQDGMRIAEQDVLARGEGDILGSTQHGFGSRLLVLKVLRHAHLIQLSSDWIAQARVNDPALQGFPALAAEITAWESAHESTSGYLEKT